MKVALIHPSLAVKGGAENILIWLAQELGQRGNDVSVLTGAYEPDYWPDVNSGPFSVQVIRPLHVFDHTLRSSSAQRFWMTRQLHPYLAECDTAIAQNSPSHRWLAACKVSCRLRCKTVWLCQEPPRRLYWTVTQKHLLQGTKRFSDERFNAHLREQAARYLLTEKSRSRRRRHARDRRLDAWTLKEIDQVIVNSHFVAGWMREIFHCDVEVCHLGVPITPYEVLRTGDGGRDNYVGMVTNFRAGKNVENVIEAIGILVHHRLCDDVRLRIVGNGERKPEVEQLVRERGLEKHVKLLGYKPDSFLPGFWRRARLVVYLPIDEPFGLVPIEAMANGAPVLVSDHGGPAEIVDDGVTGMHVSPFDPESIAKAIAHAYDSPQHWEQLGKRGSERVLEHFTLEHFVDRLETIIA